MRDALTDALNAPPGRLAEVLIKRIARGENNEVIPEAIRERLDKLVAAPGNFGELARVRLAAEVSFLFDRAPGWTRENIVPLFDWSSPEAPDAWSARKYSNFIGSPELFKLTRGSFLALFGRPDIAEDDLRAFGDWLALIMIANKARDAGYPITTMEARSALRSAGVRVLSSVGHRLATEMHAIKSEEKAAFWRNVIGPVFETIWPLDAELQSANSTNDLVRILLATGDAFPQAADVIIPFIRPEDPRLYLSGYSIATADDALYASSPEKMLDLTAAVVGEPVPQGVYGLMDILDRIRKHAPHLADTRKFQRLVNQAAPQ
jgi:hypothetical protein